MDFRQQLIIYYYKQIQHFFLINLCDKSNIFGKISPSLFYSTDSMLILNPISAYLLGFKKRKRFLKRDREE